MRIAFCVSEMAPLARVGGLAEFVGSLTQALAARGHDVRVIIPLYGSIDRSGSRIEPSGMAFRVSVGGGEERASIWETEVDQGVGIWLVEHANHFGGEEVYTSYERDVDRFHYFSRAVLELLRHVEWQPEVLHCHDWHTAAVVSYLSNDLRDDVSYSSIASVFTIHNLAHQGWFDYRWATDAHILHHIPPSSDPLHPLMWRAMALGIYHADVVSTVSETYAREILTPEYGEGLDPVLRHRQDRLYGIVNGIDHSEYDPAKDPHLPFKYRVSSIGGKSRCKQALLAELGLATDQDIPLVGYVGRVTRQKGMPLLVEAMEPILAEGKAQLAVLGTAPQGEQELLRLLQALESRNAGRMRMIIGFDTALAHRIYAGCDLLAMPSIYEPCGLAQLIALRYGTIPVVRHTGGLADTIIEHPLMGNGFVFYGRQNGTDLKMALERAFSLFQHRRQWACLVARAMNCDTSWERSCLEYEKLYARAVELHRSMSRR
jgi:starch synthase